MSRSASPETGAREELHVVQSPSIPFPAPATPLRPQRSAAKAATSSMKAKQENTIASDDDDAEGGMTTASEPDLTNDDTADSWSAGEGETDEAIVEEDDDASVGIPTEDESPPPPRSARKRKTPAKKKATAAAIAKASDGEEETATTSSPPAKKRKTTTTTTAKKSGRAKKAAASNGVTSKDFIKGEQEEIDTGILSDSSGLTPAEELSENQEEEEAKPKRKRKTPAKPRKPRAPKPEPVYVIPDVEKKPNPGYQGRLGYACLNTILRKKKPLPIFCSRTCRIDTIKKNGMDFLKELGRTNIKDLIQLIEWNEANNIRFMRLSSEMFPFASHGEYGYTLEYADKELKEAGDLVKKYGHRVTTHPGQFTQLGSPRPVVVDNAVKDLVYHCEMLDRMGMGKDSVMIIHGGGTFQDKPATLERIKKNYTERLPDNVKGRVVLENDEMCYNVDDLLPLCEELNIPMVLDYHHDWIYPRAEKSLEELMPRILATWDRKGIKPKFHLSEPRPGAVTVMERRAHSDRCKSLPTPLPSHVDLMIEAKDKEQAVLELHRIYDLQPVHHDSLRPPAEVETLHTQGRKSNKKKAKEKAAAAAAAEGEGDEDGEGIEEGLDPDEAMLDVDGAEVAPPVEGTNAKKAKTPAKRGRAKKESTAVKAENGEDGEQPKSAAKKAATPRKSRAKKAAPAAAKREEEEKTLEEQVRAEPPEAEPIEDMKMKEVPEPIVDSVPCEAPTGSQESKA